MVDRRDWEDAEQMISVDDAFDRIIGHFVPLPAISTPIVEAVGMVLAEDVVSDVDIPPFQNSAMDGYAIRAADTERASATEPARLRIVETVAAGRVGARSVGVGEAIRIMTGAPVPGGADTVIRFEETDELHRDQITAGNDDPSMIGIRRPMRAHENVRDPGEDVRVGDTVLRSGRWLRPADIGLLASLNRSEVLVHRRPRVAILSTGDEVVDPGPDLQPGQIRNSNSYTIAAMVRRFGGEPLLLGVARDTTDDLGSKLRTAGTPDLYVTSGGVSLGDYDMVKDVLRAEGAIEIWQVRMKPGKPLAFGTIGEVPLLGLPGNPAAALVSFEQFGRPAIRRMLGRADIRIPEVTARLTERLENKGRRRHYVRAILTAASDGYEVRSTGSQGAAILSAVVRSNCFLVVPETCDVVEPGTMVQVQLIDQDAG